MARIWCTMDTACYLTTWHTGQMPWHIIFDSLGTERHHTIPLTVSSCGERSAWLCCVFRCLQTCRLETLQLRFAKEYFGALCSTNKLQVTSIMIKRCPISSKHTPKQFKLIHRTTSRGMRCIFDFGVNCHFSLLLKEILPVEFPIKVVIVAMVQANFVLATTVELLNNSTLTWISSERFHFSKSRTWPLWLTKKRFRFESTNTSLQAWGCVCGCPRQQWQTKQNVLTR